MIRGIFIKYSVNFFESQRLSQTLGNVKMPE